MKLRSIETTPSPQCIKLNLDQPIATKPLTLSRNKDTSDAPQLALKLLEIQGVQEVFLNGDFITLTRNAQVDWQPILAASAGIIGLAEAAEAGQILDALPSPTTQSTTASQNFGQVEVAIQVFRGIPVQVRAIASTVGQQPRPILAANLAALVTNQPLPYLQAGSRISEFQTPVKANVDDPRAHGGLPAR